jgi:methyltransferase (TIGR00027 family)
VLVGVGLDMRPFRLAAEMPDVHFFEIDLPPMLAERERVAQQVKNCDHVQRTTIAADFILDDLSQVLRNCEALDPHIPTAVIYEGCSMYFERAINEKIYRAMGEIMRHPESRIWTDFVKNDVVIGETTYPEVTQFLKSMDDLGESFIFGHNSPDDFALDCGLRPVYTITVRDYRQSLGQPSNDPVLDTYQFAVAAGR